MSALEAYTLLWMFAICLIVITPWLPWTANIMAMIAVAAVWLGDE